MKKIFLTIALACTSVVIGCNKIDSLLDTTNYQAYDTSNFPTKEKDAEQIITAVYSVMPSMYVSPESVNIFRAVLASDELFGAGSTSNTGAQAIDRFMEKGSDGLQSNLKTTYQGIFRANYALEAIGSLDDNVFSSVDTKNYILGQAHFLRAWFFWELADKFETFPVKLSTAVEILPRGTVDECFQAIADDLQAAISLMPAKYGYTQESGLAGKATKYAAEALLARVWMFYTGFYDKSDMFGITKSDIVACLKDVRDNSKFGLESDPREIWPYTNEYSSGQAYGVDMDTYVNHEKLQWVGNHSKETLWACHFSYVDKSGYNRMGEYFALRNSSSTPNERCYPYGIGYTNGAVNPKMVEEWFKDPDYGPADKRLWGSVFAVDNAAERYHWLKEEGGYVELPNHKGNDSKEVEKTMFHNKKYTVSVAYSDAAKTQLYRNFFYAIPGFAGSNSNQFDNRNDAIYIRYADVLLMLDELEGTVTGMNQLRARAGLAPYSEYSFERLQKERRYELAFEGVRYDDLRRWYGDQAGKIISDNQVGASIEYRGNVVPGGWANIPGNGIVERYAKTRGFWMMPNTEIELSEGTLEQTPGFGGDDNWLFGNGDLPYPTSY